MKNNTTIGRYLAGLSACLLLSLAGMVAAAGADLHVPFIKSGTVTYSNVTVYGKTDQDLYIHHDQGLGNVKISTLDDESLRALGLKADPSESPSTILLARAKGVSETVDHWKTSLGTLNAASVSEWAEKLKTAPTLQIPPELLWGIVAGVMVFYLLVCLGLKAICRNAGAPAGLLIFVPVLQLFPLLRAARMPLWSFLLFLIPVVNIGVQIWWSFAIVKACGKGVLTAILLLLPVTNLFAFLYLALAKNSTPDEPPLPAEALPYNA